MTWKQIKDYIDTLSEHELNEHHAMAYNELHDKYYLITETTEKSISDEACLNISEL